MPDSNKKSLLLHICCAGCGAYVSQILGQDFIVSLFFYNPNIYPESEYKLRAAEVRQIAKKYRLPLITGDYNHSDWLEKIKGLESEPEKGRRCDICYSLRLFEAARQAKQGGFHSFASTLSVSPHKKADKISEAGKSASQEYGVSFLDRDFKKQDGFKKAACLSRELGLYRQGYCGCEFSRQTS